MHSRGSKYRPRIAFVDPCCAGGYDLPDLEFGGLGGTEATVLRVAAALRDRFDVAIYQNDRSTRGWSEAGALFPLAEIFHTLQVDGFVVINRWKVALKLRRLFPDKPIFLWLHIYPGRHNRKMGEAMRNSRVTVICVSETHARKFTKFLGAIGLPKVTSIYNPIANDLHPDNTPRNPNRLLFASSPHKGLSEVFKQFASLSKVIPALTLAIADPGYLSWETGPVPKGVVFLGSLSHGALVRQMRRSMCLFYPQTSFAETFGLVLAEANAVGTPALVHSGLGANDEILQGSNQQVDGCDPAQIFARVTQWQRSPPKIEGKTAFRLANVADAWMRLLSGEAATCAQHPKIGAS